MPYFHNAAIELCQQRALRPWLQGRITGKVLDVGCGVGRWSLALAARGASVTGLDVSPFMIRRAIERARAQGLSCEFTCADVRVFDSPTRFDLILSVTVLQHIVDRDAAQKVVRRLAGLLAEQGQLVLLEAAPRQASVRCDSSVFRARDLEWYRGALAAAGLQLSAVRGVDPSPLKTWLLPHYQALPRPLGLLALAATTAVSFPVDWLFGPWLARWSWHNVIVARRDGSRS
jgi:SAM-dependent methyltransferase